MRYIVRRCPPRSCGWVESDYIVKDSYPVEITPEVDGPAEFDTGLVTASGEPIWRVQDPIGFGRAHE